MSGKRFVGLKPRKLMDALQYIAENASGGDVPESWSEWASGALYRIKEDK